MIRKLTDCLADRLYKKMVDHASIEKLQHFHEKLGDVYIFGNGHLEYAGFERRTEDEHS